MIKVMILLLSIVAALLALNYIKCKNSTNNNMKTDLTIYILVDNNPGPCRTAWGLSILVDYKGKRILFDTGPDPKVLEENARKLGVNLNDVDFIVISHDHGDHTGGLSLFKNRRIFVPPESEIKGIRVYNITKVSENVFVIPFGFEQALAINYSNKLILITGCAHPGILRMAREAVEKLGLEPYMIIGGFHLGENERKAREVIRGLISLGFKKIVPIHCSGETIRRILEREYKKYYIKAGVCSIISPNIY